MSALNDHQNYLARADAARLEAEAATLENVRDRCLRAESAWRDMAERAERTMKMRATLQAAKDAAASLETEAQS